MRLIKRTDLMPREIEDAIRRDAVERYPEESIGVISGNRYIPLENIASRVPDGEGGFLDPKKVAIPDKETFQRLMMNDEIDALIHSHPDAPFCPSAPDMQSQIDMDVPFGVLGVYRRAASRVALWGDQLERPDLIDRGFQHGITDCYEGIRDWYLKTDGYRYLIAQFVRDWEWWGKKLNQNLYLEGFEKAGFRRVDAADVQRGDGVLFKIRSETHNHAGVYEGNDLFYHHPTAREPYAPRSKAKIETIHRWLKYDPIFVRPDPSHSSIIHL